MSPRKSDGARDPIAERAKVRLDYVARIAVERLESATLRLTSTVEALATAFVELKADSPPMRIDEACRQAHTCTRELAEELEVITAECSSLEVVSQVRRAMSHA